MGKGNHSIKGQKGGEMVGIWGRIRRNKGKAAIPHPLSEVEEMGPEDFAGEETITVFNDLQLLK